MLVYRVCDKSEINNIFNDRNYTNVGKICNINENLNTYQYEDNKKYIHFFKDFDSIFYVDTTENHFICTYNIPKYLLEQNTGIGFYLDRINLKKQEKVSEYAIENKKINFNYLQNVQRIFNYIDIFDYIDGDISDKIENYYINKDKNIDKQIQNMDKFYDIMMDKDIVKSINSNLDFITILIPEINNMIGFEHKHPHHHLDVWEHTLYALSLSLPNFDVRISLLLHDIGKPFSYIEKNGVRHFPNHANVSALISNKTLERLGFDKEYIDKICYLIKFHDTPITAKNIINNYDLSSTLYKIQECDALAHNPEKLEKREEYLKKVKTLMLKK